MKTSVLRSKFLEFFKNKGHKIFPSDSLVPDDPTVLFTSAGMNQFKPYFLGKKKDVKRAASCQKCLRTQDIDRVGYTSYHHTFFEMLGNFSFGDYFKKEACCFAWEFVTKELNIDPERLWVSVYKDDDETFFIWNKDIGIDKKRIVKLGEETNFWPANAPLLGPDGPCGPCSEIFFDYGEDVGCGSSRCDPSCDCGRFVEIWNLVFTQFNRVGKNKLEPLPQKNIDTGMGLERIAAVLQGKDSNFKIDIFVPLVDLCKELLGVSSDDKNHLIYAIVDHIRAVTFAIGDGVYPSNEERGYVIRKLIRKAFWTGYTLGMSKPFLYKLVPLQIKVMEDAYSELSSRRENIAQIVLNEEEKFISTVERGREHLFVIIETLKEKKQNVIPAEDVFRLYDTYGFPWELTRQIADEEGLMIDEDNFYKLIEKQKSLSRKSSKFEDTIFAQEDIRLNMKTEFIGYDKQECDTEVIALMGEDNKVKDNLSEGERGEVVLRITPFYPESGGQLADHGEIFNEENKFIVEDVKKIGDTIVHYGKVEKGIIAVANMVRARIDVRRRKQLMRAHTATHLLQSALRRVLGEHVTQQGSLVAPDRLRFDFTHFRKLSDEELERVETLVNEFILAGDEVKKKVVSLEEAKKENALAFFKEKYGDYVRVVSISNYSKELCGGTHVDNVNEIGLFTILQEASISSGIRRIEAVVGKQAVKNFFSIKGVLKELTAVLKCSQDKIEEEIDKLITRIQECNRRCDDLKKENARLLINSVLKELKPYNDTNILVYKFENKDYSQLLYISDEIRKKYDNIVIMFFSSLEKKNIFVCSAGDSLLKNRFSCRDFIRNYTSLLGLKGGGRDISAQGVCSSCVNREFLDKIIFYIKEYLGKCGL